MFEQVIANIVNKIYSGYIEKESVSLDLSKALDKYLSILQNKLKYTKNVIFRNAPVNFYDIYIPVTVEKGDLKIRIKDPLDILNEYDKIGIIGAAGSGKTTLLKHIALRCLETEYRIPIMVELRKYEASDVPFEYFVASQINEDLADEVIKLFSGASFIFIFDGYDEIDFVSGEALINQINSFITKYYNNKFVISSRPGTNVESLLPFYIFKICPFNRNDIALYLDKMDLQTITKEKVFQVLRQDGFLAEMLNNPLFLSLFVVSVGHNPEDVPQKKSIFLRNIIDYIFSTHDVVSKLGYVRERISGLDKDKLEIISSTIAFRSFFTQKFNLSKDDLYKEFEQIRHVNHYVFQNDKLLYDLTITVNILVEDGSYYLFPHILILEYLTAIFIARLSGLNKEEFYRRLLKNTELRLSISLLEFIYDLDDKALIYYFVIPYLELENQRFLSLKGENYRQKVIYEFLKTLPFLGLKDYENLPRTINTYDVLSRLKNRYNGATQNSDNPLFDVLE